MLHCIIAINLSRVSVVQTIMVFHSRSKQGIGSKEKKTTLGRKMYRRQLFVSLKSEMGTEEDAEKVSKLYSSGYSYTVNYFTAVELQRL